MKRGLNLFLGLAGVDNNRTTPPNANGRRTDRVSPRQQAALEGAGPAKQARTNDLFSPTLTRFSFAFDDLASLEAGEAREFLKTETVAAPSPPSSPSGDSSASAWIECRVLKGGDDSDDQRKKKFYMYIEDKSPKGKGKDRGKGNSAAPGSDRAKFTSRALILTAKQVGESFYLSQYEARTH